MGWVGGGRSTRQSNEREFMIQLCYVCEWKYNKTHFIQLMLIANIQTTFICDSTSASSVLQLLVHGPLIWGWLSWFYLNVCIYFQWVEICIMSIKQEIKLQLCSHRSGKWRSTTKAARALTDVTGLHETLLFLLSMSAMKEKNSKFR